MTLVIKSKVVTIEFISNDLIVVISPREVTIGEQATNSMTFEKSRAKSILNGTCKFIFWII